FSVPQRRLELRATARDRIATPLRLAALAGEVRELARSLRPQVVFGWGTRAAMACAPGLRGLERRPAFVFQNHDMLQGPVIARVARAAAASADLIIAPSAVVARDLDPDGALDARTVVVPFGVDLARYDRATAMSMGDRRPEALLLGAIVGWKRPRLALEAVALAGRELPDLRLRVAGPAIDAESERTLTAMRRRAELPDLAGRVEFAGALDEPASALGRAGALLHTADCEPYGMVLVEALASGTPVVAPASCGPAEIVDPTCGRHFLPGDARGAARALVEVLGEPQTARRLGVAGRERAERVYSLADSRERYSELLNDLVDRQGPRRAPAPAPGPAPEPPGTGIALVTVIHDSAPELGTLLASVERHLPGARVIVADSGSSDDGAAVARAWAGGAEVVDMGANVGFGVGSNAGLDLVTEPVAVVLNPDVELLDDSLAELAREAQRPGAPERLLAPVVLLGGGRRQDSAQHEPGSPSLLVNALLPPAMLPRPLARRLEPWRSDTPRAVGWAVGACLCARTETLRRLGPFDARAFMYAEDLDLGLRAADAGIETWFWPDARVLHQGAHSTRRAFGGEPFDLLARRRRAVVRKWRGGRRQQIDDWVQLATFANRMAIKVALGGPARRERRQIDALLRARREDGGPG
ncbi:MAG: N-acetylglucosaminyl-diphospho-decaprenol L-rhamnosyltransferase, partial [Thermoleophilaceae bacterium]|nr:N-acetylglucosaminyl-diphospho-decaprenol L-rhamnosyltransferase [Thermoleophilaceae bacterium]